MLLLTWQQCLPVTFVCDRHMCDDVTDMTSWLSWISLRHWHDGHGCHGCHDVTDMTVMVVMDVLTSLTWQPWLSWMSWRHWHDNHGCYGCADVTDWTAVAAMTSVCTALVVMAAVTSHYRVTGCWVATSEWVLNRVTPSMHCCHTAEAPTICMYGWGFLLPQQRSIHKPATTNQLS